MIKLKTVALLVPMSLFVVTAVFFLDRQLDRKMAGLKAEIIREMEARLGRHVRYGSLSPSIFGFLDIRDLQVGGPTAGDADRTLLSIDRLRVHYRFLRVLLGGNLLEAVTEIAIAHSVFTVDFERDRELLELVRQLAQATGRETQVSPARAHAWRLRQPGMAGVARGAGDRLGKASAASPAVHISGANITLDLRANGQEVRLSKLFFTLATLPQAYQLTFRAQAEARGALQASARLRMSGQVDRALQWSDLLVRAESLRTGSFALQRQTFRLTLLDRRLELRKIQDRAPLDLYLAYVLDSGRIDARLNCQDFRPSSMLTLLGPLRRYAPALDATLSVSGDVSYLLSAKKVRYALDVETQIGRKLIPFEVRLAARLDGDEEVVRCRPLVVRSDRGGLEFVGSVSLKDLYPEGLLDLIDVQAFSGEAMSASLQLARGDRTIRVSGQKLVAGPLALQDLGLELTPQPDRFLFDLRTSLAGPGSPGTLRSHGELIFPPGTRIPLGARRDDRAPAAGGGRETGAAGSGRAAGADRRPRGIAGPPAPGDRPFSGLKLQVSSVLEEVPLAFFSSLLPGTPAGRAPASPPAAARPQAAGIPPQLESLIRGLRLSAVINLSTDFSGFQLDAPGLWLTDPQAPGRIVYTSLAANRREVRLQDFSVRYGSYHFTGDLAAALQQQPVVSVRTAFRWQEVPFEMVARYLPGRRLELNGSYGLSAAVDFPPPSPATPIQLLPGLTLPVALPGVRGTRFSFQVEDLPVPLPGVIGTVRVSTQFRGAVGLDGAVSLDSGKTVIRDFPLFRSRENRLEMAFTLEENLLQLRHVSFSDPLSTLEGSGRLALNSLSDFEGFLRLGAKGGGEEYTLRLHPRQGRLDSSISFRESPLARFGEYWVTGTLSGEARVDGTRERPRIAGSLLLNGGRINEDPIGLSFSYQYQPEEFRLQALNVSYLNHRIQDGAGRLDVGKGEFRFQSGYTGEYSGKRLRLRAVLEGTLSGARALVDIPASSGLMAVTGASVPDIGSLLNEAKLRGQLFLSDIQVGGKPYDPWQFRFEESQKTLSLSGGPENCIRGQLTMDGSFQLQLLAPLPIRGEAAGRLEGRRIESIFNVSYLDIRSINFLAPNGVVRFMAGSGRGELRISGPVNDPDFFGRIHVRGGSLGFSLSPNPVEPVEGLLVFNEKTLQIPTTSTLCGGAEVIASGTFTIDHWIPTTYELLFNVTGRNGLPIRYAFGPVFANGYVWGNARVMGDSSATEVRGEVLVDRCQTTLQEPAALPPPEYPAAPLLVEMQVTTGKRVEFFWPSLRFPVVRTFAKQGAKAYVLSDDAQRSLVVNGEIDTRGGEIFYFDRSFYLKQGRITFRESGTEFDPRIEGLAELRERDQNNEEIRVYLEVNDKLSQFSPRFYSVPARTDRELLSLIGGSITDRIGESRPELSAVLLASDMASQFFLLRPFEQAVRDLLHLDLFTVRTQMVQNVLFGKLLGDQLGASSLNPLDNTTLSLGKYLGTDLFLEMQLRFQTQGAVAAGIESARQIRTEGELSFEWQTPLFLLEWTFTPRHPETLFLSDNTLGISWGFSY